MRIGSVEQLWRYPMKSAQGETLLAADVTQSGMLGDRGWAVRDEVRGGIRGAKKIGALMNLAARYTAEPTPAVPVPHAVITLPDGSRVRTDDADAAARISQSVDHPITLWPLQPATDLDHYRRGSADGPDPMTEARAVLGLDPGEPMPDFSRLSAVLAGDSATPPGTYFDACPVLLITDRSLRTLSSLAPGSRVDVRRFRPNIVVRVDERSQPGVGFPEQSWVGERIRIGEVELEIVAGCPRCVMITRGFADLPQDRDLMRAVVRDAGHTVGVYANVVKPGRITGGDAVADLADQH